MTSLLKKLSISIKIHVVKPLWSVSKLSTESVGSRREPVANCVHTADADATQLDSLNEMMLYRNLRFTYLFTSFSRDLFHKFLDTVYPSGELADFLELSFVKRLHGPVQ